MVASVYSLNGGTAASSATTKSAVQEQEDRFLKLLVTQMKNQDPLNPLDNAQVTTQMAQLSTVTGIEKLNATLEAFTKAQAFQAVGMIGRYVLAPGDFVELAGGAGLGGFELPSAADKVKVSIYDANGNLVRDMDMGKQDEGVKAFQWDGKTNAGADAPEGSYTFTVAASLSGQSVLATNLAVGKVQSVLMDDVGPALSVQGMGLVDLADVKQIL
jgi:flagellar basal-body rod modification protein FlgD